MVSNVVQSHCQEGFRIWRIRRYGTRIIWHSTLETPPTKLQLQNLLQPFQRIIFVRRKGCCSVYQRQEIERAAEHEVALPVESNDVIAVIENDRVHEASEVILEVL